MCEVIRREPSVPGRDQPSACTGSSTGSSPIGPLAGGAGSGRSARRWTVGGVEQFDEGVVPPTATGRADAASASSQRRPAGPERPPDARGWWRSSPWRGRRRPGRLRRVVRVGARVVAGVAQVQVVGGSASCGACPTYPPPGRTITCILGTGGSSFPNAWCRRRQ